MFSQFRTRAATRALTAAVVAGSTLGLAFGALCLTPGPDQPSAVRPRAQALARAAQAGYAAARTAAPAPAAPRRTAPRQIVAAVRPPVAGPRDLDCLAAAVYYEARGESASGQAAVAQVVLNRMSRPTYPKSVCAVVYQGLAFGECQFSFACNGAMRGRRDTLAWVRAREVATRALAGYVMTAIGKATCFHATHMAANARPDGGEVRLGGHVFYTAIRYRFIGGIRAAAPVVRPDAAFPDAASYVLAQGVAASARDAKAATADPQPSAAAPAAKTAS